MPELPEVETCLRGILPWVKSKRVKKIIIRNSKLRWPIPKEIHELQGQRVNALERRGKYLLLHTQTGCALLHLGMSGRLYILPVDAPVKKHDHVDIVFSNGFCLRLNDARRFGALLWLKDNPLLHPLLVNLGVEPLSKGFTADYLFERSRKISRAIKLFIMDSKIVVGIGNIYANEALFLAAIDPRKPAKTLSKKQCETLIRAIQQVLQQAITAGGTTLKDFQNSAGEPGYFQQKLNVYGRQNLPCYRCHHPLVQIRLGQRSTVFCEFCQKK